MNSDNGKTEDLLFAHIGIENCTTAFDKLYSYRIPENIKVFPGMRVMVPFGSGQRKRQGFVFAVGNSDELADGVEIKSIFEVLDSEPVLSPELVELAIWLKKRTFCTYFEAARAMLPGGMCMRTEKTYTVCGDIPDMSELSANQRQLLSFLLKKGEGMRESAVLSKVGLKTDDGTLKQLISKGLIAEDRDAYINVYDCTVSRIRFAPDIVPEEAITAATPKQRAVLTALCDIGEATVKELCYFTGTSPGVVDTLIKKGYLERFDTVVSRSVLSDGDTGYRTDIELSDEQQRVYSGLSDIRKTEKGGAALLFGVTGSGKTSIYLKLIDDVLDTGKNVIVMVPEISLTPQTLNLFRSRYGKTVAVFHSGLSVGERRDEWKRIKNVGCRIVVGTRSAVFAPLDNIGLIVIDEEQEHTYKSEMSPRYHARDVGKFRCAYNNALLLLCSATPSVETYANAIAGNYALFELNKRYGTAHLPEVRIVDMSVKENKSGYSAISRELLDEIDINLQRHEQTILLLNRRGYNTFVACSSCKKVLTCPNCSISLTYHSANNRLMCHYCGYSAPFTDRCPSCGELNIRYSGCGTQKLEEELKYAFPEATIARMDADTTAAKYSHERTLSAFAEGKYDILLGTQMVAKGLDFPNVTLVGVTGIDQQLYGDDYRSSERAFDLITQVVGRSGRGSRAGRAVIQTSNPDSSIISLAASQDYKTFFNIENDIRRAMTYPPYCDLCHIGFSCSSERYVEAAAQRFLEELKILNSAESYSGLKMIVFGPLPPRVAKISSKFRAKIIIKVKNNLDFRNFLGELLNKFNNIKEFRDISVFADINPESDF